jgi:carbon monoxide dehydrogenase subunit G
MLQFEGERTLAQDPATCWSKLTDLRFLSQCISNIESAGQSGPDMAQFKVRPGVSFVRGTLEVTVRVEKTEIEKSARFFINSRSIGLSSDAEAIIKLEPGPGGTHLSWTVVIKTLGGLLKAVPQGLIKASAQKVITDIWSAVEQNLSGIRAGPQQD